MARLSLVRVASLASLALATAFGLACGGSSADADSPADIRVDGSSTVFVLSEAVAEEFTIAGHKARVTVGQSGTGGGFQKFCRGETDVSNASRPIRAAEIAACKRTNIEFIELPVAYDGIAIVVHPNAHWVNDITVAELKTLWAPDAQGQVTRWSQVRAGWPDREIHLYGAGVDSGTYDYFTEAVIGKEGASRGDFTASEDDNVLVQGIGGDELALGFLPFAYFQENQQRLKVVPVDNLNDSDGRGPIAPNAQTIRSGDYQPLARPLFVYVSALALRRPEVQQFVDFYIAEVGALSQEVGYVELGDEGYRLVASHLQLRRTGTLFGEAGSQIGLTIEQLLAKERQ